MEVWSQFTDFGNNWIGFFSAIYRPNAFPHNFRSYSRKGICFFFLKKMFDLNGILRRYWWLKLLFFSSLSIEIENKNNMLKRNIALNASEIWTVVHKFECTDIYPNNARNCFCNFRIIFLDVFTYKLLYETMICIIYSRIKEDLNGPIRRCDGKSCSDNVPPERLISKSYSALKISDGY